MILTTDQGELATAKQGRLAI